MSSILEQCYDQFIEEFPESWLPNGNEEEVVFFPKIFRLKAFLRHALYY